MAQILSGEFIHDALLQRAEQLAKQEVKYLHQYPHYTVSIVRVDASTSREDIRCVFPLAETEGYPTGFGK